MSFLVQQQLVTTFLLAGHYFYSQIDDYDRQYDSNFVIGHDNFPYIAWRDLTGSAFNNLYFTHWNGTAWSSMDTLSSADIPRVHAILRTGKYARE